MKKTFITLVTSFFLISCNDSQIDTITHIPFQMEKDGRWGLIDMEGNSLIEDEFKKEPSVVINGMFCVKNSDGLYEFYTAKENFQQIGDEYLAVGYFSEGLAPVVKKNSRINYIDKKGEVLFELTNYKDDPIESARSFDNGIAIVRTISGKEGCINTKGEFIIPPIYSSIEYAGKNILRIRNENNKWGFINKKGEVIVTPQYTYVHGFNKNGYALVEMDGKEYIIDDKGKEILKLKEDMKIRSWTDENLMVYSIDNKSYGYINLEGEKVIKLSSNIKEPTSFYNDYAIFKNSDGDYGIINKKGEIEIRAKYDELRMYDDFILYEDNDEWGFLSYSGETIKRASYKEIAPFWDGYNSTFAKDDNEWILINKEGEEIKKKNMPEIYNLYDFYDNGYSYIVKSDYWDIDMEISQIIKLLKEDGKLGNLNFNITPSEFVNTYNKNYLNSTVDEILRSYGCLSYKLPYMKNLEIEFSAYYSKILDETYENKWVSDNYGGHYEKVLSYSWNNTSKPTHLSCDIILKEQLQKYYKETYDKICEYLKNNEYIERKESESKDMIITTNINSYYKKNDITLDLVWCESKQTNNNYIRITISNN